MADGTASVTELLEIAAERGLLVDMHCDETDDPMSRHIETLSRETHRLGLQGRVTASHLTSMHVMDNYYVSKLIPLIAESEIGVTPNPLTNIAAWGDNNGSYPKWRGMTRVPELREAGITLAFGQDCVMDPWYAYGSADMLEVAHMGSHVAAMFGDDQVQACFDAITVNPAKIMHLDGYGLEPGCHADMIVLQAADPLEAHEGARVLALACFSGAGAGVSDFLAGISPPGWDVGRFWVVFAVFGRAPGLPVGLPAWNWLCWECGVIRVSAGRRPGGKGPARGRRRTGGSAPAWYCG